MAMAWLWYGMAWLWYGYGISGYGHKYEYGYCIGMLLTWYGHPKHLYWLVPH